MKDDPKEMKLRINDHRITHAGDQAGIVGPDEVLLDSADNLIEGTAWESDGFTVAPFLEPAEWETLHRGITDLIRRSLVDGGAQVPGDFRAEDYHRYVEGIEGLHMKIVRPFAKGLPFDEFPVPASRVVRRIEELLGKRLTLIEPGTTEEMYNMRAVRPRSGDNNPLHRDPWLDHLSDAVNLYVPIAGSNERSSLALVPGSHLWKESEITRTPGGAQIGETRFSVPALVGAKREVRAVRPNPGPNEVLVFTPYLLHGGATNLNPETTRVSLEIRLWRAPE